MHQTDFNKVVFHSKKDMSGGYILQKGENILRTDAKPNYNNISEVLKLHNLKKHPDNDLYLKSWPQDDIIYFKQKATEYGKVVGQFLATINDSIFVSIYRKTLGNYIHSLGESLHNQSILKRNSKMDFSDILKNEPHLIHEILVQKGLVDYCSIEIKPFLLEYLQSAELLPSFYEVLDDCRKNQKHLPQSLTVKEKATVFSSYLDPADVNYNYIDLTQNANNRIDFKVSDNTCLKAKLKHKSATEKHCADNNGIRYGVSVNFSENTGKIKNGSIDDNFIINYTYSLDFIKQNCDPYSLLQNFIILFEFIDIQNRINLISKKNKMDVFERILGVHSHNEYSGGTEFNLLEMASHIQIAGYTKVLQDLEISIENVLHQVFTLSFQEYYGFASNARFLIPSATTFIEKVRLLAPEFESVLKQFKLFVEEGSIDFELLQSLSNPISIKNIPSLNKKKYIYINEDNQEMVSCMNLLFSYKTLLAYVEPYKEKHYHTFFDMLVSEQVKYSSYEEHQKSQLDYLIDKGFMNVDSYGLVQVMNPARIIILRDLYFNEVASFYRYSPELRQEAEQMEAEKIVFFDNSLFSKPEQAYFNYYLNKSEFTNGLDLRNRYLHRSQVKPDEIHKHEYAYFTYLKLLVLAFLKIEDDLIICNVIKNRI